uniref:uncharacterized protein LOC122591703 n=1 Tax=Erigeron canadensis TaxID=72917 RepID=UPI001CB9C3E2|nr:uncharacterized protein LOC122591703 [Erigeron canadensis]
MKERDWLDEKLPQSFPTFSESRHNVLCSELKHLYVAITRTRQRLWICENKEELSKPMFDYWKRKGLVQIRKLDSSVAQAMQVSSSPQEWWERGKKLFYENNYVMATMCFERAGKTVWEKLAKASGLRASADQMRVTNPEAYLGFLREAAGMFESIEKFESAASCYCDLGEYERAGKIYMYNCGKIDAAAECFTLAGCYSDAAEAYAKGDQFYNCLSACKKGKLFDKGMQYIEYWKEHVDVKSKELEQIEQEFLESCAFDYHEQNDPKSMMKFVKAFCSMESKRGFLRSLGCLDDLLLLEEETGLFLDAVELARSRGDVIKEADLFEKAGQFKEATLLLLWYMFFGSLWGDGNRGWPLTQFSQKEELCRKAKSLAKMDSDSFYDFTCNEIEVLSDRHSNLTEMYKHLHNSQNNNSLRGEILALRKIMDSHLHLNSSSFDWEDELPIDINKHCDEKISENRVSVRTLVFYWNMYKQNVVDIFQSLGSLENEELNIHKDQIEFSLNYFGVRKQCVEGKMVYLLVNKDADWVRTNGENGLHSYGKHLTIDIRQLVFVIRSYWQSELVSVGIRVLETLVTLRKSKINGSTFHQSTCLLHMFELSKFLLNCQHLSLTSPCRKKLHIFSGISATYFDLVFPLDWRKSVSKELISLRETDLSANLLVDIILQSFDTKGDITYWTIGRVMMICLTYGKQLGIDHMIVKGLQSFPAWKSFVVKYLSGRLKHAHVALQLQSVLEDTLEGEWRRPGPIYIHSGSISIHSIVYFLDSIIFHAFISSEIFLTTRSSLVGWLEQFPSTATLSKDLSAVNKMQEDFVSFIFDLVQQILLSKDCTLSWIQKSKIDPTYYHPILALKLVMLTSLFDLQANYNSGLLFFMLLGSKNIAHLLPPKFVYCLLRTRKDHDLNLSVDAVAQAFLYVEDPLVIVSSKGEIRTDDTCAIFVDFTKSKEEILNIVLAKKTMPPEYQLPQNFGVEFPLPSGPIPEE